jgi:hypothetical protein
MPIENGTQYVRYYQPLSDANETIYAFVPELWYTTFYVSIIDLVGIQNATLESYVLINGTSYTVERRAVTPGNNVPFICTVGSSYGFKLRCSKGTIDYGRFSMDDPTQLLILQVNQMNFPSGAINCGNITISGTRMNSTWIQALYNDAGNSTSWVNTTVTRMEHGVAMQTVLNSYAGGGGNFSFAQVDYYDALASQDYVVTITSNSSYGVLSWSFSCPSWQGVNPWSSLDFGDLPFPASQLIGFIIVIFLFACSSVKDSHILLLATIVVAGFLAFIGWLQIPTLTITVVMCLAVLYAMSKRRPA